MKKLLGIIVLGLLLSGNAYADEPRVWFKNENTIHIAHKTHPWEWHKDISRIAIEHCNTHDKYMFWVQTTGRWAPINKHYKSKIKKTYKQFNFESIKKSKHHIELKRSIRYWKINRYTGLGTLDVAGYIFEYYCEKLEKKF